MKLSYSPRAIAQISEAFEYVEQDNPAAANAFLIRVEEMAAVIAVRPRLGRMTRKPDVHVIGLLPYRYLMFYKVLELRDEVRIIRVRHMRRKDANDLRGL